MSNYELTSTAVALIKAVNAHLSQIERVSIYNSDEASLVAISGSLRFLLVDDMLIQAWKFSNIGGPITIRTWCIESTQEKDVFAFCGGGDLLPGIPMSASRNASLAQKTFNLRDFTRRTRIQINSVGISTNELIQYVANTLGGTHFDPEGRSGRSRKPAFDALRNIDHSQQGLSLLFNNRSLLHHEVLSVAQSLLASPEVGKLRALQLP